MTTTSLRAGLRSVEDSGELPAKLSRGDLATWLSCVDALPLAGDGLERLALSDLELGDETPGRLQWLDDDDLDDEGDEMAEDAMADLPTWRDLAESLERLVNPVSRLSDDQRRALQGEADQAWWDSEPLVLELEDALAKRTQAVEALEALSAHESETLRVDRARRGLQEAEALTARLLTDVIGRGLERRLGLYLRSDGCFDPRDEDWRIFKQLWYLGGRMPPGIACCDLCGLVFRPRYGHAAKCDRCHANPRTPALSFERLDGGGRIFRSPAFSHRQHACQRCGALFTATRSHAEHCDPCKRERRRESAARSRATQG